MQTAPARRCGLLHESRPLTFFAGLWTRWTSVRKVKEGETTNDLYGFLTTAPNAEVKAIHPKAMPVILTTWRGRHLDESADKGRVSSPAAVAGRSLQIVARGDRTGDAAARSSNSRVDSQPFRHFVFGLRPSTRHRSFQQHGFVAHVDIRGPTHKARSPAAPSSSSACPVGSILPTARSR